QQGEGDGIAESGRCDPRIGNETIGVHRMWRGHVVAAVACAAVRALLFIIARASLAQSGAGAFVECPRDGGCKGVPGAPQHVTLIGDPSKPGLYVDRIKFAAGTKVMPHWHPDPARTVLVMSGTFYFAIGETWDETKLKAYPAGTLYSEPPKTPHYA